ncbi:hypothetical protein WICPIJ_002203 [Wickerhamomyces pijperi]|uniref:Peroxisomal membrane protein PEX25 n=1 Tax=Wickerhamomyces pijperi TaxID=599730 RepID=A0A9P8TPV8_WICPI|nr:hypothetical protein WICPIJ_002203 [Wickerhamomyces pijperi]
MDYSIASHNGSTDTNIFSTSYHNGIKPLASSYGDDDDDTSVQDNDDEEEKGEKQLINVKPIPLSSSELSTDSNVHLIHKRVKLIDIILSMIKRVAGKDKIAKIIQYSLNIFKFFLIKSRGYMATTTTATAAAKTLLTNNPLRYLTALIVQHSLLLESKISFVASQISSFRYAMRFGTAPLLVYKFLCKLQNMLHPHNKEALSIDKFFNLQFLSEVNDVYYQIFDELELLFKLKIFTNPEISSFVSDQAAIGWMIDILLTFKNKLQALQENRYKQQDLSISIQVRTKASELSSKFLNNTNFRNEILKEFNAKNNNKLTQQLTELREEEVELYFDLLKNSCDFTCDFIDLFGSQIRKVVNLSPLVYLGSGWCAGFIGARKVWKACEKELAASH